MHQFEALAQAALGDDAGIAPTEPEAESGTGLASGESIAVAAGSPAPAEPVSGDASAPKEVPPPAEASGDVAPDSGASPEPSDKSEDNSRAASS